MTHYAFRRFDIFKAWPYAMKYVLYESPSVGPEWLIEFLGKKIGNFIFSYVPIEIGNRSKSLHWFYCNRIIGYSLGTYNHHLLQTSAVLSQRTRKL